ncbi:MAG: peptide-methionine (S)-S-oxide reductase [Gracilimonas sp.]|nr:peptide-methionine (S)-S-oxide reductase [Gracilimonas sp.]
MNKILLITGLILSLSTNLLFAQNMDKKLEKATFGAGCFWCVEAIYEIVEGVELVESGYSGGDVENPSYR